jgi:signal transduction histidine kinase
MGLEGARIRGPEANAGGRLMKRWWSDTLFKRLFALLWIALVVSHLVAWELVMHWAMPPRGAPAFGAGGPPPPVMPALPPTPGLPGAALPGDGPDDTHLLPTGALLFDYGVRLLIIGAAAWWGARWLAAPMRRLVDASHALASSLGGQAALPAVDERRGTVEVREAARVFNDMARQLDAQFKGRGLLVAAISHDLRTPLTRMRMRLEAMRGEPLAERCIDDVREMNELIDSTLEMFRGEGYAEAPRSTDVLALVQALADDLAEQGHDVPVDGMPAIATVQPAALRRAVGNLLGNAVRYGQHASARVLRDETGITILVEDDGPGIPQAQLDAVFEPFYRVESSRNRATGGTGLGLYIARDLVRRQGGRLALANRAEGGVRAAVFLPGG